MKIKLPSYIVINLIMAIVLAIISWKSFTSMQLDTSIDAVLETDPQSKNTYEKFNTAFYDNTIVIIIAKIENLFSNEGAKTLYELSEAIEEIPDLTDIKSLTHSYRPVKGTFLGPVNKWVKMQVFMDVSPKSNREWQKLKKFNTDYPMSRGLLVSKDGNYASIVAALNRDVKTVEQKKEVMNQIREKVQPFIDKGITVKYLSEPFITAEFHDLVLKFMVYFITLSLLLTALIIYVAFRSWRILLLMLLQQGCGFMVFPVVFALNKTGINLFTFIIIPLGSAIQLTFLIHFYSVFQDKAKEAGNLPDSMKLTLQTVLKPSLTAFLTSTIGMGALYFSKVEVLQTIGIVGMESLGLIFLITFGPAILLSSASKLQQVSVLDENRNELSIIPLLIKYKYGLIGLLIALTISCIVLFPKIDADVRTEAFLDPASETRQAFELLDKQFGGISILQLEVVTDNKNGIQDYEVIKYLDQLRKRSLELDGVLEAYTYSQFYTTIHQLVIGDDLSTGNVLPNKIMTVNYSLLINTFDFPFKHVLQSDDGRQTYFFLRTERMPSREYLKTVEEFKKLADQNRPPGVRINVNKGIHTILESDKRIVDSQLMSLEASLLCIFICLMVLWVSLRLAAASVICNLVPLALIGLIMVIGGIPLNSITVMVSAIILGISVDDSIHFLSFYKSIRNECKTNREAVSITLRHKLRPMICTSLILITCLFLFYLAPFPPVNQFGILGGCALIGGLLSSCILLPAFLLMNTRS